MKLALLRFFAKRPLTLAALTAFVGLGGAVAAGLSICGDEAPGSPSAGPAAVEPRDNPRKLVGRGWFDKYPEKRKDTVRFFFFGGGGIGIYDEGSAFRYSVDVFELERQGDKVTITFLQDEKKTETRFTITACDDEPPFDLCLDLADSPRGPKRYHGFDDDEDEAALEPWVREMLEDARARAK